MRDRKSTSARSGQVTRSGIKSADRIRKKLTDGVHHGDAGVALQRDSKLTVSNLIELRSSLWPYNFSLFQFTN